MTEQTDRDNRGGTGFAGLPLPEELAAALKGRGIAAPTPVQERAVPAIAARRDATVRAQTGTGKTLAYLLPVLASLDSGNRQAQAAVVAPTQELAMQIYREAEACAPHFGVTAAALIGGASLQRQIERLKRHPQLVVGTPGRMNELIKLRKLPMHGVRTIVVDEADDVFALESASDAEAVLQSARRDRQLVFVSATSSARMEEMAAKWMNEPERIDLSGGGLPASLTHHYYICDERDKIDALRRWLRLFDPPAALVFVNETDRIGEVVGKLGYKGLSVEAVYGDAGKIERARIMQRFRTGLTRVLVATDVAARGMDIPQLTHILQLDPATDADHYVHRAGRAGRMGAPGTVLTLVAPKQRFIMDKFAGKLGIAITEIGMREGRIVTPVEAAGKGNGKGKGPKGPASRQAVGAPAPVRSRRTASGQDASKKGATRKDRAQDTKNKGAPRWLKEKRQQEGKQP